MDDSDRERLALKDRFRRGLMPSEGDFAAVIDGVALKREWETTAKLAALNEEKIKEAQQNIKNITGERRSEAPNIDPKIPIGLIGRYGRWENAEEQRTQWRERFSNWEEDFDKRKEEFKVTEVIAGKEDSDFAFEILAQVVDSRKNRLPFFQPDQTAISYYLVMRSNKRKPSIRASRNGPWVIGLNKFSQSVVILIVLLLVFIGLFNFNEASDQGIGVTSILLGILLAFVAWFRRPRVKLSWKEGTLRFDRSGLPKDTCTLRYHATRLW